MNVQKRLCIIMMLALPGGVALAQQSTPPAQVTAGTYDGSQLTEDIDISCKKLDLSSTGVVSGTCTYDNQKIETGFKDTSLDLDTKVGCKDGSLTWDETDFSDDVATGADIVLGSTGSPYLLEATCPAADGSTAAKSTLTLDEKVKNSDGLFAWE